MVKVKICGLRRREDIEIVNELLPDYAGFVFCNSKRRLDVCEAAALCAALDGRIKKVGVFAFQERAFIEKAAAECGLDAIQLHGDETPEQCVYRGVEVWKAVRVRDEESVRLAESWPAERILFDAYDDKTYGGSGKAFDWELLRPFKDKRRMVLAGGLSPENVAAAALKARPYAVDVSSGVETDGRKDYEKVKLFIENARRAKV